MRVASLAILASAASLATADVSFTSPAAGSSFIAGTIQAAWKDSGTAPLLSALTSYQLFLCAGGNDESTIVQLMDITSNGLFVDGNLAEGTVSPSLGASTPKNAYFLKMISVAAAGGTVINYSSRFTITGMTGVFPDSVLTGLQSISGTAGPASQNNVGAATTAAAANTGAVGSFAIPFADQTGPFRYATMQAVPPSKITKKSMSPVNPTSPFTLATTFLPPAASIQSTVTAGVTWTFSQIENTASAAPMPADDMQKFLNRWKD